MNEDRIAPLCIVGETLASLATAHDKIRDGKFKAYLEDLSHSLWLATLPSMAEINKEARRQLEKAAQGEAGGGPSEAAGDNVLPFPRGDKDEETKH